jgi:VWFA-related protein
MPLRLTIRGRGPATLVRGTACVGLVVGCLTVVDLFGVERDRGAQDGPPVVFRDRVDMVEVSATVRGRDGHLVSDLMRDDFRVFVDGRPVPVEVFSNDPRRLAVAILIFTAMDRTHGYEPAARQRAAGRALVDALGLDDIAVIGSMSDEIALSPHLTSDKAVLRRVLDEELWPGPVNAVGAVANMAMDSFKAAHENRRHAIVFIGPDDLDRCVFWDDGRSDPRCVSARDATRRALVDNVLFYGLPLPRLYGIFEGRPAMMMSRDTGGGYAELSDDDEDLAATMARVVEGLRRDYLLGFTPPAGDGREHRVEVRVDRPGTRVFARRTFRSEGTR